MMTKEQRNEEMIKGQQMIIQSERDVNEKLKKTINELIKFNEDLLDDFKQAMEKQWKERKALGLRVVFAEMKEFQKPKTTNLSIKQIIACLKLKVWDAEQNKMIGFKEMYS